jgi:hypothetical protein
MPELTLAPKPERRPVAAIAIAVLVLIVVAVGVFLLNPRKTAEIHVEKVDAFAPHTEMKAQRGAVGVIGESAAAEDDLYVVATVKIEDKLRLPLFLGSMSATMTTADGTAQDVSLISPREFPRLVGLFPAIEPKLQAAQPWNFGDQIAPGETKSGEVLMLISGETADAWKTKRSATLTFALAHQAPLTVELP